MGMNAGDLQGQQGQPAGTEAQPGQGAPGSQPSLGNTFLQQVAEPDRPIVQKYIGQWDAGVTQRFQQLQNELAPYKQLGDPDTIQTAMQLYELMDENPMAVYQFLVNELSQDPQFKQQLQGNPQIPQSSPQSQPFQGAGAFPGQQPQFQLPEEFTNKFSQLENVVQMLAQGFISSQEQAQAAQEDAALDAYLGQLKQQFGDYDENYVLAMMNSGMDGAQAVQQFQQLAQQQVNGALNNQQRAPVVLSGNGSAPMEQRKVTDLNRNETKNLVANLMEQAAQAAR